MKVLGHTRAPSNQIKLDKFIGSSTGKRVDEKYHYQVPFLPLSSPEEQTPTDFFSDMPLYPHQKRSLHRMIQIESLDEEAATFNFGKLDYVTKGGCLADAIGMGKTASMLALIVSEPINVNLGGNLLIAPSHLLEQWKKEIEKFIKPGQVTIAMGMRQYLNMDMGTISNRTIVLIAVEDAIKSTAYFYKHGQLYPRESAGPARPLSYVNLEAMEKYKAAAKFVNKAYSGLVWTTKLHLPDKPWRRVIFEEVQDLVLPGKESQDCFIQLTHHCMNVWLITATPFPAKVESIKANNQLLGFKRLKLLPHDEAFNEIKRKLYLRNCAQVKEDAITDRIKVHEVYVTVKLHPCELLLCKIEQLLPNSSTNENKSSENEQRIDSEKVGYKRKICSNETKNQNKAKESEFWEGKYKPARQSCVHIGLSNRILERDQGNRGQHYGVPAVVKVRSPMEVYKNEKYHLDIQRRLLSQKQKEVDIILKATENTVNILKIIESQTYWSVADCFTENGMKECGVSKFFNDVCETTDGFRMSNIHKQAVKGQTSDIMDLILYQEDEIEGYLRKHWDSHTGISRLRQIMEQMAVGSCLQSKLKVQEDIKQLDECFELRAIAETEMKHNSGEGVNEKLLETKHLIPFFGSKITSLVHYIKKIPPTTRIVLFTMWTSGLKLIQRALRDSKISSAVFLEHQSSETKAAHVESFVNGDSQVLLLNSLTSASGINLQVASYVIFLDPSGYTPIHGDTIEAQAIGRVLRMGQVNTDVHVVRFVAEETMEMALYEDIRKTNRNRIVEEEKLFDGAQNDLSTAYVCDGFNAPLRRVVRMEVRNTSTQNVSNANVVMEDEEFDIMGSVSLEDAIRQRVERAAIDGDVCDLTIESDAEDRNSISGYGEKKKEDLVQPSVKRQKTEKRRERYTQENVPTDDNMGITSNLSKHVQVKLER